MGDWIDDVFDAIDGRVVDMATRYRLEDLLETARLEGDEDVPFLNQIHSPDLQAADVTKLFMQLHELQPRTPDKYAPSQTELATWIQSFCL